MTPQTNVAKTVEVPPQIHARLVGVRFVTPIQFAGVTDSVQIGRNCISVCPARIEADGSAVPTEKGQASQGLLVRGNGRGFVAQSFVAWNNVSELMYGP